jgi:hypothetical protein
MPFTRFSALVLAVSRSTTGLVSGKLDGENALMICFR